MSLVGRWFWHDEAKDVVVKRVFHGQFVAEIPGTACYLCKFDPNEALRPGTQEVVSLERIINERWSIFDAENELRAALNGSG